MKVLLDECVPRKLKNHLPNHDCQTVPRASLAGKKNGELLLLAEQLGFEVLLTVDRGVEYKQDMRGRNIAIIILVSKSNRLKTYFCFSPLAWLVSNLSNAVKSSESVVSGHVERKHFDSSGFMLYRY